MRNTFSYAVVWFLRFLEWLNVAFFEDLFNFLYVFMSVYDYVHLSTGVHGSQSWRPRKL